MKKTNYGTFNWDYLYFIDGRLVLENGKDYNPEFPSFKTRDEAEKYIYANDIRASLR